MGRRILLSHFDLDGVGCDILLSLMFKFDEIYQCGYGKVKEHISRGDLSGYDSCIVSDICLIPEQYKKISEEYGNKFLLIDHHPDTKKLLSIKNKSNIIFSQKFCATALIFQSFYKNLKKFDDINKFVAAVDAYDCWRFDTHPDMFKIGYRLNTIFWAMGYWDFQKRFFNSFSLDFNDTEKSFIEKNENERDKVIQEADKNEFGNNSLLVITDTSKYVNDFTLECPQYDLYYIVYIDIDGNKKVSCRTSLKNVSLGRTLIELKKSYMCIKVAGGHDQAAGINFEEDTSLDQIVDLIEDLNNRMESGNCDVPF